MDMLVGAARRGRLVEGDRLAGGRPPGELACVSAAAGAGGACSKARDDGLKRGRQRMCEDGTD